MNKSQIKAIDENLPDLLARADTGALVSFFNAYGAFKFSKYDSFNDKRFKSQDQRAAEFFKAAKEVKNGWDLLEKALITSNQSQLWEKLFDAEKAARAQFEQEKRNKDTEECLNGKQPVGQDELDEQKNGKSPAV